MICLLTANIGDIDQVQAVPVQTVKHKYICYEEPPLPLSELNNRLKAKFVKLQHYKFLPEVDTFVYIDGRIEITSSKFIEDITSKLKGYDIVITKHPERNTTGEEHKFILDLMSNDNNYLLSRYDQRAILKESEFIYSDYPLYACGVFAWKVSDKMKHFFTAWWEKCIQYSSFDQCWFSYLAEFYNLKIYLYGYDLIKIGKHK